MQQVNANTLQRSYRPFRDPFNTSKSDTKPLPQKSWKSVLDDRRPHLTHQIEQVVHIVHREQMSSCRLFSSKMVYEGFRDA